MRKHIFVVLLLLVSCHIASAQYGGRIYTRPQLPPAFILDKLSMKVAWSGKIKTNGLKDGIATIQHLPAANKDTNADLVVQTIDGSIVVMDAENGDLKWRTDIRIPFERIVPVAFNQDSIFVFRADYVYALARKTGRHRFYKVSFLRGLVNKTIQPQLSVKLGYRLFFPPTTPPIADDTALYIPSGPRIAAYLPPFVGPKQITVPAINPESALPPDQFDLQKLNPPELKILWSKRFVDFDFASRPVLSKTVITLPGTNGLLLAYTLIKGEEVARYKVYGKLSAPLAQYGSQAFVGTEETYLYAFDVESKKIKWRFFSGGRIKKRVHATYLDVFVTPEKAGLCRLDRKTGKLKWRNRDANLFLGVNQKFVYGRDRRGNLLVIDYLRGRTLAKMNTRAWTFPVSQTNTDRLYMTSHNGRIMCLHLAENETPVLPRLDPDAEKKKKKKNGDLPPIK